MTPSRGRVLVLGSINVDLVTRVERHPRPGETVMGEGLRRLAGGKGANQAAAERRAGADVRMVGSIGDDEAGQASLDRMLAAGIDASGVWVATGPTGHALITVDDAGENSIVVIPGANASVGEAALVALGDIGPGDVLLTQLEIPLATVAAAVRHADHRGARVVLNLSPYAVLPRDVVAAADPLVVNEHEVALLADSDAVPRSLVVTFGGHGARWDDESAPAVPVAPEAVVDTTGAGDAFCGALAAALAAGASRTDALQAAVTAGALAVQHHGAQPDPELT